MYQCYANGRIAGEMVFGALNVDFRVANSYVMRDF